MSGLVITLLGPPRVELNGVPLQISTRKAVALLSYLAVTGIPHTRDALATLFWPESDHTHARGALRYTLAQLKAVLGDGWLAIAREQIGLASGGPIAIDITIDAVQVKHLLAQVQAHGHPAQPLCDECLARLQEIVRLYQGRFLAGFGLADCPEFDDWLLFEGEQLEQLQAKALAMLVEAYRASGVLSTAIVYAQRWLALDSLDEAVNHLLIELYLANNQRSAARRHFANYTQLCQSELGVSPGPEITELMARAQSPEPAPTRTPPEASTPPPPPRQAQPLPTPTGDAGRHHSHPLPVLKTPLLGRERELSDIGALLDDPNCRLLTLLGPGGSGKTCLALAVAHARQKREAHGVVFVPLVGLTTPNMVIGTLAAAIGARLDEQGDAQQQLLDQLREEHLLLVLDNLEHLLERPLELTADAPGLVVTLLDAILTAAPNVQLLVTSQTRLHLYEEQLYIVEGLTYPRAELELDKFADSNATANAYGALQLFTHRARRVQPNFALTPATLPGVLRLVRLLAGQPLAIELAAAWIGTLTADEITDEITGELAAGIDLLATKAHNLPERHRSMRATYLFSWMRLKPAEQALHQALSVFRGGFTRAAAADVTAATPRALQALLDQSLLTRTSAKEEGTRYTIHELLRQFAAEQLARDPRREAQVRQRHAAYYLGRIAALRVNSGAKNPGGHHQATLAAIESKLENVRVAWIWAVEQQLFGLLAEGMEGLCDFYQRRGRVEEGLAACDAVLNRFDQATPNLPLDATAALVLGHALTWKAAFEISRGHLVLAATLAERSLLILPPTAHGVRAFAHRSLGQIAFLSSDLAAARHWLEGSLTLYQTDGNQVGAAHVVAFLGRTAWLAGDYAQARHWYMSGLSIHQAHGDVVESARTLADLAMVTLYSGAQEEGLRLIQECQALIEKLDDPLEIVRVQRQLGTALLYSGLHAQAQPQFEACIAVDKMVGNRYSLVQDQLMLGLTHLSQRHFYEVNAIGEEVFSLARALGLQRDSGFSLMLCAFAKLGLGAYQRASDLFEDCLQSYQLKSHADDQSLTWFGLSVTRRALGDLDGARHAATAALRLAAQGRGIRASIFALIAQAAVLLDEGEIERAIELTALLVNPKQQRDPGFYYDYIVQPVAKAITFLPPAVVEEARVRGRKRTLNATVVELLSDAEAIQTDLIALNFQRTP